MGQTLYKPGGALVIILQTATSSLQAVSPSTYKTIRLLAPAMRLLDQAHLQNQASAAGFLLASSRLVSLQSGNDS